MPPIYRQLFFILLSAVSLMMTCNRCQQRKASEQWGPELEKQLYDVFYLQSEDLKTDEATRKEFANCCIAKMKVLFPNGVGGIGANMSDSLKRSVMKMGAECAGTFSGHIDIWSPEAQRQLKLRFYSFEETKSLMPGIRYEFVDCLAFKVTAEFPHGLGESGNQKVVQDFIQKSRKECLLMVNNKYEQPKKRKTARQK